MRVVVQRVREASVTVQGEVVGNIGPGIVALVGLTHRDTAQDVQYVADKVVNLRIFADELGKMNRSVLEVGGELLSVSQFTLYGDCSKGRRPNFTAAARPEAAECLYRLFNERVGALGIKVETGRFGAEMQLALVNDGPVTICVESLASE